MRWSTPKIEKGTSDWWMCLGQLEHRSPGLKHCSDTPSYTWRVKTAWRRLTFVFKIHSSSRISENIKYLICEDVERHFKFWGGEVQQDVACYQVFLKHGPSAALHGRLPSVSCWCSSCWTRGTWETWKLCWMDNHDTISEVIGGSISDSTAYKVKNDANRYGCLQTL